MKKIMNFRYVHVHLFFATFVFTSVIVMIPKESINFLVEPLGIFFMMGLLAFVYSVFLNLEDLFSKKGKR